jgi:hypothetical protein
MDCKQVLAIFEKVCVQTVKCYPENYNVNFPVAEELHIQNCIRIMQLNEKYCKGYKVEQGDVSKE